MNYQLENTYISTNGIRLHLIQAGPVDGQPVVLLHGFPEFWRGWLKQIEPLARAGFRVIVPDQRGYNLSDRPKEIKAYRTEELIKDIIGLLDSLSLEKVCLAGHDWGAAVAWGFALYYPARVSKLAILNVPHPVVMMDFLRRHIRQMLKSWYIAFFQIPGLADWLVSLNDFSLAVRAMRSSSRPGTFRDEDIIEYKKAWRNSNGLTGMINWYRALARHRSAKLGDPQLHIPVRILWGKRDAFLSSAMAEDSLKWCENGGLIYYEKASHWVQHEEAESVANSLIEFFKEL